MSCPGRFLRRLSLVTLAFVTGAVLAPPARAAADGHWWFDDPAAATLEPVRSGADVVQRDRFGRQVVLRGFNVSGEVKLGEYGHLPFRDLADARESAAALRRTTGANTVRFLISWERVQPRPGSIDREYLGRLTAQMRAFLDRGFYVLPDYHQDLYSRHLFGPDSRYTGDGAPRWVVEAGGYPPARCVACVHWGQNMLTNEAVRDATADFWHNRELRTPAGPVRVQDAFLRQAGETMRYFAEHLAPGEFARVLGMDPLNEPESGKREAGRSEARWERDLLWPFYQRFRDVMDDSGWWGKPAYIEPSVFWNNDVPFIRRSGGFRELGALGRRYVFNAHYYDALAQAGLDPAEHDGQSGSAFREIRERAAKLGSGAFVSEFGHPVIGTGSGALPGVLKAMYQGMDSRVHGRDWWRDADRSGTVLSGTQWHWDTYSGRHREPMNGNPERVQTEGDAWNGEDFSLVRRDEDGKPRSRVDPRLLDRLYPRAVAGETVAFTYEDRARSGQRTLSWNEVPRTMPALRELVGDGRYGVLVWRGSGTHAPTELHLPATFDPRATTVLSDLGATSGLPEYRPFDGGTGTPVAVAPEPGGDGARRLLLTAPTGAGPHYALVANRDAGRDRVLLARARAELDHWARGVVGGQSG